MKRIARSMAAALAAGVVLYGSTTPALATTQTTVQGLVHLWSGEGNASDPVGGANGTLGTTTGFAPGLVGQAFDFRALETSIIELPVDINPGTLPQMTVGMWVKLRSNPATTGAIPPLGWVFGHDNANFDRSLALHDFRYQYGVAGGTGPDPSVGGSWGPYTSTLPQVTVNEWHCVAASYDSYNQTATFYEDGLAQTVSANPGTGEPTATLGGLKNFPQHTVDGLVDEVFLFNRALNPGEIATVCGEVISRNIESSAGANGSISPSGTVAVAYGANADFAITPATGYHVLDVLVDGVSVGAVDSYTFSNVTANHTIAASFAADNHAPDVSAAAPSTASIWPPNHRMVDITINGVTDADGDAVTITITGITNNETGTADASGIGTSTAQVKATRFGKGTGRTYTISFTATDGKGGTASGSVTVVVPHDQGGAVADDDDQGDDQGDDHGKVEKKDDDKGKKDEGKVEKKDDDKNKKTVAKGRAKPTAVENATWGEVKNSQH